ncbi:DUF1850 domain-containing protein [Maledivibacter halophilus]|uniref:DUF1850 domain-containing protein n=1 Tax=Maledivibacter halophilus TaxID=36842 RepID=A0A1T5IRC4_9FIRM|nr:DUF1850 domain-containing protein [Maledivibacter halophilus]SKC41558.1 hypothetical protein SAMN02194393_00652 [Maledivibacter halophilus]
MKISKKIIILFFVLISFTLPFTININTLVIKSIETNKVIFINHVKPEDEFSIKWMHSVELQPWEEIFRIDSNYNIILYRTKFKQFGAGVPDYGGNKTEIKDGYIIFKGINRKIDNLSYGISSFAKHTFSFKDKEIKLYKKIEDGNPINIYILETNLINYIIKKITVSLYS